MESRTVNPELDDIRDETMELSSPSRPIPLLKLPVELHKAILDNLTFFDDLALKLTSRYFWKLIEALDDSELLQIENSSARSRRLFKNTSVQGPARNIQTR